MKCMYLAGEAVALDTVALDTVDTLGPGEEEGDTAVVPAGKGKVVGPEGTPGVVGGRQGPATGLDRQAAWGSLHHRHPLLWARLRGEGSTTVKMEIQNWALLALPNWYT